MVSCPKDARTIQVEQQSEKFSLEKYENIKKNHFNSTNNNNEYAALKPIKLWKYIKAGLADIGGAIGGFTAGQGAGKIIDEWTGGEGWNLGLGISGAVAGGTLASDKVLNTGTIAPPTPPIITANDNNPFDFVGAHHYSVMFMLQNELPNNTDCGSYDYQTNLDICKNQLAQLAPSTYNPFLANITTNFTAEVVNGLELCEEMSYSKFISYSELPSVSENISANARAILIAYMQTIPALQGAQDNALFIDYSLNMENVVKQESSINELDRAFLLSVMATSRYAVQYWEYLGE